MIQFSARTATMSRRTRLPPGGRMPPPRRGLSSPPWPSTRYGVGGSFCLRGAGGAGTASARRRLGTPALHPQTLRDALGAVLVEGGVELADAQEDVVGHGLLVLARELRALLVENRFAAEDG